MSDANNLVLIAGENYRVGDFARAKYLYEKAAEKYGEKFFSLNIELCRRKLEEEGNFEKTGSIISINKLVQFLLTIDDAWLDSKLSEYLKEFKEYLFDDGKKDILSPIEFIFWNAIKNKNNECAVKVLGLLGNKEKEKISSDLLELADCLKEGADLNGGLLAVSGAYEINKVEKIFRALYWAGYNNKNFKIAKFALKKIIDLGDARTSSSSWLKAAESRIEDLSALLVEIKRRLAVRSERTYEAIPKRIAYFLHNSLPYSSGGYATRAQGVAKGLSNLGFEVLCVSRPGFPLDTAGDHIGKELASEDVVDGIRYLRIFEPSRKRLKGNVYMLSAADAIVGFLKEHKVEAVLAASNYLTAIPAGIAAREVGIPFFYEVRGFWEVTRVSREPEYKTHPHYIEQVENERLAADSADVVFTLTRPMKEELVSRGVDEKKITVFPNSCDLSKFNPREKDLNLAGKLGIPKGVPVIGYIGSFVQYEGLEHLAQACAELAEKNIDFRLLLVGNENASGTDRGPITEEIMRVASEEGLADKLIMPGRVPHDQVEAFYSLIDIAPFPRKPQPVTEMVSPMKPLEALAMEKAVVVSSVRAMAEMIEDNKTGLIFEKGNIKDLSDKLEILIKDKSLREKLGKNGREWVRSERTWVKTSGKAKEIIDVFLP
ncbi:glycosyltransferase family 4 protein [Alcaligenes sp. WGS1538]|uniref:glycosyltransferase family 4 protein n=1 Tax=Alcaligenes sp. WGS1538 TaxID=3366811 RepID=UPI00372CEFC8